MSLRVVGVLMLVALLGQPIVAKADVICLTETPVIPEGGSVVLRAWQPAQESVRASWTADAGRIEAGATLEAAHWDLSQTKLESSEDVRRVIATAGTCSVTVFIAKRTDFSQDGTRGEKLLSARHFLLPNDREDSGYGLYSYVLFSAPPKNAEERARYLKMLEACLQVLQGVDDYLARHVRPRGLNITYLPLKRVPQRGKSSGQWAENVLAAYDYATAQLLLAKVNGDHDHGPYLLSTLTPLSKAGVSVHLWEDLTGVVPELAWDWVRFFTFLAAQERSWSEETLGRFGLNLRNLVGVGGKVTPETMKVLEKAIEVRGGK